MRRTKVIDALRSTEYGTDINVKGWVRSHRSSKAVDFIALNDGSTIKNIQIVVDPSRVDGELLRQVTTGACVNVTGTLVESQGKGRPWKCNASNWRCMALAATTIPCRRRGRALSTCGSTPTCVCAPIPLAPCSASVTTCQWPSIPIFMSMDSFISIRPS